MSALSGKIALVTEADREPCLGVARALAAAGAAVVLHAVAESPSVADAAAAIDRDGGHALAVSGDLSSPDGVALVARAVEQRFARVDVLVLGAPAVQRQEFVSSSAAAWDEAVRRHLHAAFLCAQRWVPAMVEAGDGRIIHLASIEVFKPARQRSLLMTCQAGIIGMMRALAAELGPSGITVNAVVPGLIEGDPQRRLPAGAIRAMVPAARLGRPDELGALCVFLASDMGGYINGQTLHWSGGRVMA